MISPPTYLDRGVGGYLYKKKKYTLHNRVGTLVPYIHTPPWLEAIRPVSHTRDILDYAGSMP